MNTGFRAAWAVLRAALFEWIFALVALVRRLSDLIQRHIADERDEHERNAARTRCVPVEEPAFVRPDPLLYSQQFLMEQGFNVTWRNPDFFLLRQGAPVDSHELEPATTYDIVVRVWNASVDGPVVGMPVHLSFLAFGAGTQLHLVDTKKIDVGVKGGANEPAFVKFEWTTPPEQGHYCLQALLDPVDDAEFGNNLGQHNTNVVDTSSPGVFSFDLGNDTARRHEYHFAFDTYVIPHSRPCTDELEKGDRSGQGNAIDRVHLDQHPLPPGWSAEVTPDHPSIGPGDQMQILITLTPPDGFEGVQVVNVHALYREYHEERVAGGVTVSIRTGH